MSNTPPLLLIVDDDDAARFVKAQTLRRAGFRIIEAATGQEGLRLAGTAQPDLLVLDVNLPDISGLEVCRRIRAAETMRSPVQILQVSSTAVAPRDQVLGLEHGADVYLTEPVAPEVLVATVQSLLRVRRAEIALGAAVERERAARTQAEEATRLRDEFIALLSHELRTPLNAVMGWIWQLRHSSLGPDTRSRALDSLERNARLQVQLISDLLDVSRIAKGKLLLELTRLELREVVTEALESVSAQAAAKELQVDVRGPSATVIADYGRLQQIIINLVTNAIQFTPAGGRITLETEVEDETAVLRIRDTGVGIEPEMLDSVFDQFQQGPGGQSRKHGGLGLGLAVVRQLTELHDGHISVESAGHGHGTVFKLQLPRETDGVAAAAHRPAVLAGLRLMLWAGEESVVDALKTMLEINGAETHCPGGPVPGSPLTAGVARLCIESVPPATSAAEAGQANRVEREARCIDVTLPIPQARLVRQLARLEQSREHGVRS